MSLSKVPLFLSDFSGTWIFSTYRVVHEMPCHWLYT